MKRKSNVALYTNLAFAMLLLGAAANVFSQHCPFDGGSMIVVQLTDAEDKPLFGSAADLTLLEVGNPEADSCSFTKGLLSRAFLPPVDAFMQRYARHGSENFRTYCEDCAFNADGFYAVIIGQSEQSCIIKKDDDTDYRYVKRKFEIRYKRDNVEQTVAVPPNKIFSMCTGAGNGRVLNPSNFGLSRRRSKSKTRNTRSWKSSRSAPSYRFLPSSYRFRGSSRRFFTGQLRVNYSSI